MTVGHHEGTFEVCGQGFKVKPEGVVLFVFFRSHINIGSYGIDGELD